MSKPSIQPSIIQQKNLNKDIDYINPNNKYINESYKHSFSQNEDAPHFTQDNLHIKNPHTTKNLTKLNYTISDNLLQTFTSSLSMLEKNLKIDQAAILKISPNGKEFIYETGIGFKKAISQKTTITANSLNSLAGYTFTSNRPVIVKSLKNESRFLASDMLYEHNSKSGVCVIIQEKKYPFVVLQVFTKTERIFSETETNFIQSVADLIASATENELDKKREEFLNIASHEIKTPLTSLKTFSQLLSRHTQKTNDKRVKLYASKIESQIDKLSGLVMSLLDISKINYGPLPFDQNDFQINKMIEEIISDIQMTTNQHKIVLKNCCNNKITGDKYRIGQVLTNLLINAIKYSPSSNKVIVEVQKSQKEIIISVEDFGIGIPTKDKKNIFDKFYKCENRQQCFQSSGLGLGLYISSEIIKQHKGNMWVESSEGKGSKFYFTLPIKNKLCPSAS